MGLGAKARCLNSGDAIRISRIPVGAPADAAGFILAFAGDVGVEYVSGGRNPPREITCCT